MHQRRLLEYKSEVVVLTSSASRLSLYKIARVVLIVQRTSRKCNTLAEVREELLMERIAVSLTEAEKMTSLSRFTLRRQIKCGALKATRVGRRLVIPISELEKLVHPSDRSDRSQ